MTEIYLDPYLFAVPSTADGEEAFVSYIHNLLEWKYISDEKVNILYALRNTHGILFDLNSYPLWDDLEAAIRTFNINYVQAKDIITIVDSFLQKFKKIEDEIGVEDFLIDNFTIIPDPQRHDKRLTEQLANLLSLVNLKTLISDNNLQKILFTKGIHADKIRILSNLLIVEFTTDLQFPTPLKYDFSICCFNSFNEYCTSVDLIKAWQNCKSNNAKSSLVKLYTFKTAKEMGLKISIDEIDDFSFGSDFNESLKELNFDSQEDRIGMLLRCLSETLLQINQADTHSLRDGSGANNKQIEADGFKGFRRDINYEFHLHYWKKSSKYIFSRVVTHNDFAITF